MANFFHLKNTPRSTVGVVRDAPADGSSAVPTFSVDEVTNLLQVTPERLRQWGRTFPRFLEAGAQATEPHYSQADLATLIVIQKLLEAGHDHEQVAERLSPQLSSQAASSSSADQHAKGNRANPPAGSDETQQTAPADPDGSQTSAPAPTRAEDTSAADVPRAPNDARELPATSRHWPVSTPAGNLNEMVNQLLHTVSDSQQSMLNIQDSIREMLGVIVQDNFNLKNENRKLRERMLELERSLSEYQRREETRKERMEGRLRAVESTLSAIQQQVAQIVQVQRQRQNNRRGGWFR